MSETATNPAESGPPVARRGRRLTGRVLVAAVALLATSLGGAAGAQSPRAATSASPAVPARTKTTTADAIIAAHITRVAASELFGPLAANAGANGNLVFSPASLTIALGMLRAGAAGPSATQIDRLLHTTSASELAQAMNALDQHLTGLAVPGANDQGNKGPVALSSANALFGQQGVTWQPAFLGVLASRFGSTVQSVDYQHDTAGALQTIDQWVSDHTNGQIPHLLTAGDLSMVTVLTLVNALFFKAPWFSAFAATSPDAPFRRLDGHTVETPTMTTFGSGVTHLRGAGWTAVRLPYAGQKLAMTVIEPDNGQFGAVRSQLERGTLLGQALTGRYTTSQGELWLPRFDIRTSAPLNNVLQGLGVTAPFKTSDDFDPMSHQLAGRISISHVVQQATIAVDEKGTEASAATGIVGIALGEASNPFLLHVDHPFFFVVHDVATGAPLFVGQIGDPTQP